MNQNNFKEDFPAQQETRPAAPGPQVAAEVVSRDFISQFYQDKVCGVYQGREKEAQAIEAKINRAVAAGRVR